jgi:hypothetical protein
MNKTIAAAVAAFVLGGVTTGVLLAQAQPAGPPGGGGAGGAPSGAMGGPPGADGRGSGMGRGPGQGPGQWADSMREHHARRMEMMRVFALIDRPADRQLTPPDVQKIAEAFLLWNGNHTWKVINVKQDGDVIAFDLATADGSVIAHYAMDPKTGRPSRKG